ncbi:replication protein RepA [Comamonas nitrativorans]|uniref:Replication protein RepA n=1 Tax=Comamonas nitrativorans TaxID=108437 RepID=A0ABV9GUR9_9BURK
MLLESGGLISANAPFGDDLAFHHSLLCSLCFPRRAVPNREFLRQTGDGWLHLQAGVLDLGEGPVLQPVPYGPLSRLALIWISTAARRSKSREVFIGRSASQFLGMLGYDKQGRRYCTLRQQLHALAACRIQLGFRGRTVSEAVIKRIDAWLPLAQLQRATWPGSLLLDADFFDELVQHSVPLDARALHALRGSALALDIYVWLAHRLHRLNHRPLWLPWHTIKLQFGSEYQGKHAHGDFCTSFKLALSKVLMVYPDARVCVQRGGIELRQSPPPVPTRTWLPANAPLPVAREAA